MIESAGRVLLSFIAHGYVLWGNAILWLSGRNELLIFLDGFHIRYRINPRVSGWFEMTRRLPLSQCSSETVTRDIMPLSWLYYSRNIVFTLFEPRDKKSFYLQFSRKKSQRLAFYPFLNKPAHIDEHLPVVFFHRGVENRSIHQNTGRVNLSIF